MTRQPRSGYILTIFGMALLWAGGQGMAQDAAVEPVPMGIASPATGAETPSVPEEAPASTAQPATVIEGGINPNEMSSLLFTYWEHTAIIDAKRSRGRVRPPTEEELMRDLRTRNVPGNKPPPEEREISLGGIVYVTTNDWTIWLNGKRVTPKAIPHEVMDLKVFGEYIEMKWFDDYTNQIFPIRLRPHQRFNIDTRIFLPG